MFLRIQTIGEKKLVGNRFTMSLSDNRIPELWKRFMPGRKYIKHVIATDLYDVQIYDHGLDFMDFTPDTVFEKWAAIEVSDYTDIPGDMETHTLSGGMYAVFLHIGPPHTFPTTFNFIFSTWLPASGYETDDREHFEVLGALYKNNEPDSQEEVWIPVKLKE